MIVWNVLGLVIVALLVGGGRHEYLRYMMALEVAIDRHTMLDMALKKSACRTEGTVVAEWEGQRVDCNGARIALRGDHKHTAFMLWWADSAWVALWRLTGHNLYVVTFIVVASIYISIQAVVQLRTSSKYIAHEENLLTKLSNINTSRFQTSNPQLYSNPQISDSQINHSNPRQFHRSYNRFETPQFNNNSRFENSQFEFEDSQFENSQFDEFGDRSRKLYVPRNG